MPDDPTEADQPLPNVPPEPLGSDDSDDVDPDPADVPPPFTGDPTVSTSSDEDSG